MSYFSVYLIIKHNTMESHQIVKIIETEWVTHNVRMFRIEKPEGYTFIPGQATELSINKPAFIDEKRPFTFTCLDEMPYLEFIIKIYTDHLGVTNELGKVKIGDELIIRDSWGTINYRGKGVFLAGGAGITPFIAIIRQLYKDKKLDGNSLIFSNRTNKDIILQEEFTRMLGTNFINVLTEEPENKNFNKPIDFEYLKENIKDLTQNFYLCGPKLFVKDIKDYLYKLGAAPMEVVFEK